MPITLPNTITPGTNEDVSQVQENDEEIRDAINAAMGTYQNILEVMSYSGSILDAGTYWVNWAVGTTHALIPDAASAPIGTPPIISIRAGDFQALYFTPKLRLRASVLTGSVDPSTVDMTFGLYPVAATSDGSGNLILTIGVTPVTGSTVTATLAADQELTFTGSDFAVPAVGVYALGVEVGVGGVGPGHVANATVGYGLELQLRYI